LLLLGKNNLELYCQQIPANQRRFCHQTANRAAANVCSRTGKVLRRIAQGEELVLLLLTEKRPRGARNQEEKDAKPNQTFTFAVNFGLSTEERAQIRASEAGADAGRGFACQRCGKVFSYAYYRLVGKSWKTTSLENTVFKKIIIVTIAMIITRV
jgi:hypothetical protein